MIFKCSFCRKEYFDLNLGDAAKCTGKPEKYQKEGQVLIAMPYAFNVVDSDDGPRLEIVDN